MAFVFVPGLVLNLYPAELLKYGAEQIGSEPEPVSNESYFLCLSADASSGMWTPLHPTRGMHREPIPEECKSGFPEFVRGLSFYSTTELWRLPHKATHKGAAMARDRSGPKLANRVSGRWMPTVDKFSAAG